MGCKGVVGVDFFGAPEGAYRGVRRGQIAGVDSRTEPVSTEFDKAKIG